MAPDATSKQGITQGKLILIGVLAVVLVVVVYWNYFRDAPSGRPSLSPAAKTVEKRTTASTSAATRRKAPAARTRPSRPARAENAGPRKAWPRFELAEVIARDPFQLPRTFPQPRPPMAASAVEREAPPVPSPAEQAEAAAHERADVLAAIKQQGVQLIFQNGQEYVAKIGDRQVRVGDKIGGLRVVDISLRGVVLEGEASP